MQRLSISVQENVFKFYLRAVEVKAFNKETLIPHNRLIPTHVKIEVWKKDEGQYVICGSTENLHYDHDLPFSKGGTSLVAENLSTGRQVSKSFA